MNLIMECHIPEKSLKNVLNFYTELKKQFSNDIQVAVRSSAVAEDLPNASFAGQQDTYLNIVTEDDLIYYIKKCISSLFNSRAISYRKKNNISYNDVKISIAIQKMIRSDTFQRSRIFT